MPTPPTGSADASRALLEAWREQRADHIDPVRFGFIEALARRAAAHHGQTRRLLDERLSRLIAAYANDLESAAPGATDAHREAPETQPIGALGALVDHLTRQQATARTGGPAAQDAATRPAFPTLAALDDFRDIWSGIRTRNQVRQSLEQMPRNAGPLNSGRLVHRALTLMRECSPGYLEQFLAHVDTLSWMEQVIQGNGPGSGAAAPAATPPRKRGRGKPAP
ncbi:MAG: DUF2894 domain-containing protein [Pseudomonas sp.]